MPWWSALTVAAATAGVALGLREVRTEGTRWGLGSKGVRGAEVTQVVEKAVVIVDCLKYSINLIIN